MSCCWRQQLCDMRTLSASALLPPGSRNVPTTCWECAPIYRGEWGVARSTCLGQAGEKAFSNTLRPPFHPPRVGAGKRRSNMLAQAQVEHLLASNAASPTTLTSTTLPQQLAEATSASIGNEHTLSAGLKKGASLNTSEGPTNRADVDVVYTPEPSTSGRDDSPGLDGNQWLQERPELLRCAEGGEKLRVAVLLSGGVDSSVGLRLLKAAGHQCTAFYLKIWFQVSNICGLLLSQQERRSGGVQKHKI